MTHLEVVLLAVGWSGTVGVVGLLALRRRGRSVRTAVVAVAAIGVVSLVAGVVGAARAMFISTHDLGVVVEVAAVAGVVALVLALVAVSDVVRDVDIVRRRAAVIGEADDGRPAGTAAAPRLLELAQIQAELERSTVRLSEARRREESLDASRRDLVAWVSHDLRTPLAGIRAMAEALEDGLVEDPQESLRQIGRQVDRLSRMVEDLFELSRIQSGSLPLVRRPVDLREVLHDAVLPLVATGAARDVTVRTTEVPSSPVPVEVDRSAVTRLVANLVQNAVRYSRSPGDVEVSLTAGPADVQVSVRDTCGGLPPEVKARVFEPGWRASPDRTPADGGAGLGLAVAQGIAAAHGGAVEVDDVPDGCRFTVRLPR